MKRIFISALLFAAVCVAVAQTPPTGQQLIKDAQSAAAGSKRNVFVLFQASW